MSDEIAVAPTIDATTRDDKGDFVFSLALNSQGEEITMLISASRELQAPEYFVDDNYMEEEEDDSDVDDFGDNEPKARPASEKAIEGLEKVKIDERLGSSAGSCAVCLEEMSIGTTSTEARRLPCSHIYHAACIIEWLKNSNMCPLCRHKLPVVDFDLNVKMPDVLDFDLNLEFSCVYGSSNQ